MPNEFDVLLKTLKHQRDDLQAQIDSNAGESTAAELVDTLKRLRKKGEELDETWRGQHPALPR